MVKKASRVSSDEAEITRMRAKIDEIDAALLVLIAKRKDAAVEIAAIKQKTGSTDDEERVREILEKVQKRAKEMGLKENEIKEIWKALIAYTIREQMEKHPY